MPVGEKLKLTWSLPGEEESPALEQSLQLLHKALLENDFRAVEDLLGKQPKLVNAVLHPGINTELSLFMLLLQCPGNIAQATIKFLLHQKEFDLDYTGEQSNLEAIINTANVDFFRILQTSQGLNFIFDTKSNKENCRLTYERVDHILSYVRDSYVRDLIQGNETPDETLLQLKKLEEMRQISYDATNFYIMTTRNAALFKRLAYEKAQADANDLKLEQYILVLKKRPEPLSKLEDFEGIEIPGAPPLDPYLAGRAGNLSPKSAATFYNFVKLRQYTALFRAIVPEKEEEEKEDIDRVPTPTENDLLTSLENQAEAKKKYEALGILEEEGITLCPCVLL